MNTGSKIAVILFALAGVAMVGGLIALFTGAFGASSEVNRADIDLEAVGTRFETLTQPSELPAFADKLNADELYEGDGTLRVEQAEDGSILGWVDKDGDNKPTLHHSIEDSANKEFDEPESPEVVFWVRAEKDEKRLVITDRYHHAHNYDVSTEFTKTAIWQSMLDGQKQFYGDRHWRAPGFWVFVMPGYYGRHSSARSASLGRRSGSGGIGGGK